MAEQPAAERTEQPTAKCLQRARSKGNVPQSQEFVSAAVLLTLLATLVMSSGWLAERFIAITTEGFTCQTQMFTGRGPFVRFLNGRLIDAIVISIPFWAALSAGVIAATLIVSGPNFAPEAIRLRFDFINPTAGIQQLFDQRSMVKLLFSILKLLLITIIVWFYLSRQVDTLMKMRWAWSSQIIAAIGGVIFGLCIRICIALLVLAMADMFYQKWKYTEDLKMTRQEVKQELKDTEGSPEVKGRIRRIQLQMTLKRMMREVPKAKVILVNPTHIAVALKYNPPETETPVLLAKGADEVAAKIMEIARAYGVPIIRRPELARTIFSTVQIGDAIPQNLYMAVAEVLAMLHRLRSRRK